MLNNLSIVILSSPRRAGGSSKGDWSPFEAAPLEAGKSVSAETIAAWWVWTSDRSLGVWGHAPPSAFGRAAASPQTRQMRCWPSSERTTNPSSRRKRQDSLSLSLVLFPPKPLRWVSAGALLGTVIKLPVYIFSAFLCGGGITTLGPLWLCRNNPARGLFRQKNGFLRVGALHRRTSCSLLHTVLFRHFCVGGGIITLGVRFMPLKRWTPAGHGGVFAVFMPPQNSPCAG